MPLPKHKTVRLVPPELYVEIDARIAPLIRRCWALGLRTLFCCEGTPFSTLPETEAPQIHLAYIAFGSVTDARRFVRLTGLEKAGKAVPILTKKSGPCCVCGDPVATGA